MGRIKPPKHVNKGDQTTQIPKTYAQKVAAAISGGGSTDHLPATLSFAHFQDGHECASTWAGDEMRALFNSFRLASTMTWQQIKSTGGNGRNAAGLRYKPVSVKKELPSYFSEEVQVVEMGSSQKSRFFGVREDSTFYLLWLDRNHNIFAE
ncbi:MULTISPECIES: hypothetical protein [unclassified Deinococcus]|uniref:hypothetical protein n=1 Tax=unclassified Deinococcus TaxID=2623546 RepID=UPI001C2F91E4|nr:MULTISPECIES: hypothetical protein [unclassified Deinococcus]MDK2014599.1 hypothetical protein [Deinococcus sp. 43]